MKETFIKNYKLQIKRLAEELREKTMPPLTEELFALFETTGNRLKYEEVYFTRRKFLAVFAMASYLFGRQKDIKKLCEILEEICGEECWALPAHVNRREVNWRYTIDLFACETAQSLAEIVALLTTGAGFGEEGAFSKPVGAAEGAERKLPEALCSRILKEIEKRVLTPFFSSTSDTYGWECADHNWNAVCVGSIGSAAIYLYGKSEPERLNGYLERICHSLGFYLDGFREDGTCMEGIGYFTYGMTYFTGFAEQLLRYSNGTVNLFADEKVKKIAQFQQKMYFKSGKTVSFSDGEQEARFRMGLTAFLSGQYEGVTVPDISLAADFETDSCYRFMGLLRDYVWTKQRLAMAGTTEKLQKCIETEKLAKKENKEREEVKFEKGFRHDILPDAQWSICESEAGTAMAVKGGSNNEPHNHNDIGSFCYLAGEEFLLTDLGAGEYTKEYFSTGRYGILCNSSEGHSVPIINGRLQSAGAAYKASSFEADGQGVTRIAFENAYPEGTVRSMIRECRFSLSEGSLTVIDEAELLEETETRFADGRGIKENGLFTEQLVTQCKVQLRGAYELLICGKQESCIVLLPENICKLRVEEREHKNHAGEAETVRLIRFEVPVVEENGKICCRFSVLPCK